MEEILEMERTLGTIQCQPEEERTEAIIFLNMEANGVLEAIYRKAFELGLHTEVDERKFKITLKAP